MMERGVITTVAGVMDPDLMLKTMVVSRHPVLENVTIVDVVESIVNEIVNCPFVPVVVDVVPPDRLWAVITTPASGVEVVLSMTVPLTCPSPVTGPDAVSLLQATIASDDTARKTPQTRCFMRLCPLR
jgi:hypothetical protein